MAKVREIKTRIKAVSNIQRITKTMKMIATARFQASQRRAVAAQPYTQKIRELVGELAGNVVAAGSFSHPLLKAPEPATGRELLLVLTSNRGLCGGYNANILRTAAAHLRGREAGTTDIEVVGKKGVGYFKFSRIAVSKTYSHFADAPSFEDVDRLADAYMESFSAGKYDAVKVIYMSFESASRQRPVTQQLLPLEDPTAGGAKAQGPIADYEYSPDATSLLAELLPASVKAQLFQCFNEAVVSEQVARMIAMSAATDNAADMGKSLTRLYNRARQSAITTELTEIIAGAAALE